jgi:hypothetical protein
LATDGALSTPYIQWAAPVTAAPVLLQGEMFELGRK